MKIRVIVILLFLLALPLIAQTKEWSPIGTWKFSDTTVQFIRTYTPSGYSPTAGDAVLFDPGHPNEPFRILAVSFEDAEVATVYFDGNKKRAFYEVVGSNLTDSVTISLSFREPIPGILERPLTLCMRRIDNNTFQYSYIFSQVLKPTEFEKSNFPPSDRLTLFPVNFVGQMTRVK